jgi:hypothetical protein
MSGLSRLAAVATLPDEPRSANKKEEDSTTTAISSIRPTTSSLFSGNKASGAHHSVLHTTKWDTTKGANHLAAEEDEQNTAVVDEDKRDIKLNTNPGQVVDDTGWSDDEFDFDDTGDDDTKLEEEIYVTDDVQRKVAKSDEGTATIHNIPNQHQAPILRRHPTLQNTIKPPPPPPPAHKACNSPRTFEDEFVMVLREKQESETHEMKVSGKMKRWRPISEDPVLRNRLLEVMVAQIQRS